MSGEAFDLPACILRVVWETESKKREAWRMSAVIKEEMLDRICALAKLELEEGEGQRAGEELDRIIEYVNKIRELDTEGTSPLYQVTLEEAGEGNVLREDEVQGSLALEEALQNAPKREGDFFVVPKTF